jgi:hypothetical protein
MEVRFLIEVAMIPPDSSPRVPDEKLPPSSGSAIIGALIVTIFAFIWGFVGSAALDGPIASVTRGLVVIVTILYLTGAYRLRAIARRTASPSAGATSTMGVNVFRSWQYGAIAVAEVVAILIIVRLLVATGHKDTILSAIAVIVGLHLIALKPVLRAPRLLWTGLAMTLLALAALALPVANSLGDLRQGAVGLGSALCLWWGIFPLVTRRSSLNRPAPTPSSGNNL